MAPPDTVEAATAEMQQRPYYALARTFTDDELIAAMTAATAIGITPPTIPPVMNATAIHQHGNYWQQIITLAQNMFR